MNNEANYLIGTDTGLTLTVSDGTEPEEDVCEINGTGYPTLDAALTVVQSGETIKLLQNIVYTKNSENSVIRIDGKNITFDLNGHTLNINNSMYTGVTQANQVGISGGEQKDNSGAWHLLCNIQA
ncbi:MAG: hypothetical protein PHR04_04565 [Syntrophomonadaceae bacterium]|nr:hypothetical protein [Syntrophomonadaceae bacterium]MDD3271358.1 hypothetical protein [Syntrophomonadaceae bacterium]MDD3898049.1 hypothetical protein [Syntrophomonadaceae bacterium]MDD4562533.1 hypothetical protein [Syntrophomonadaceae bacterium]